jgi:selenocysteine lyase/cysteine desulfurase
MEFDLDKARRDTPGVNKVLHFNNAGAALMPEPVVEAVIGHLRLEAEIGGYEAHKKRSEEIDDVYAAASELLNCGQDELAIVENATRAWDMAFYSLPFKAGDRILTAGSEYCSNYISYLQVQKRTGVSVEVIPDDEHGQTSVPALREMIDERVKLISITHVPTSGGLINPAVEIGRVARQAGIPYLLDACQSVGQMPIDVQEIGCDFLSATGRKYLRGPRATGILYVRRDILGKLEPPFLDIHAADWTSKDTYEIRPDARRFENWETNYATKLGLAVAIRYALTWGMLAIEERVVSLAGRLRNQLSKVAGVAVTDQGLRKCGIVTFFASGAESYDLKDALSAERVNVHVSSTEANRLGLESRGLSNVIRASVHYYNSEAEIDRFCELLPGAISKVQRKSPLIV